MWERSGPQSLPPVSRHCALHHSALHAGAHRGSIWSVERPLAPSRARPALLVSVAAAGCLFPAFPATGGAKERTSDAQLRAAGIELSWSVATPSSRVTPGSKLVVRIRGNRPKARKRVTVRVVRLSKSGRVLRVVKQRRIKAGRVTFQLPKQAGRRYRATIRIGGLQSRSALRTGFPVQPLAEVSAPVPTPAPTAAPAPTITAVPYEDGAAAVVPDAAPTPVKCDWAAEVRDPRPATATLHISQAPAVRGERRSFEVENTSPRCVYGSPGFSWERYDSTGWNQGWDPIANWPPIFFSPTPIPLGPGLRWTGTIVVPATASPGRYRVTVSWYASTTLSAELPVVAG